MITIYTVVTGDYAEVNFQKYNPLDCRFVCFSDRKIDVPNNWQNIVLERNDLTNQELSRYPKIKSHEFFDVGETTVYFDCYKQINFNLMNKLILFLNENNINLITRRHPERMTFSDEISWYFMNNFVTFDEIKSIIRRLKSKKFDFKLFKNTLNGFIVRKLDDELVAIENTWWESFKENDMTVRRDQLSFGEIFSSYDKMRFIEKNINVYENTNFIKKYDSADIFHALKSVEEMVEVQKFLIEETNVPFLGEQHHRCGKQLSRSDLHKLIYNS